MIINFQFGNFQSFKNIENISLEANVKNNDNYSFFHDDGYDLSKFLMIIGSNGSGKSNLLRALSFITWFMFDSFGEIKPGLTIPAASHFFSPNDPTSFRLTFRLGKEIFEYSLTLKLKRVLIEQLRKKNPKTKKFSKIFKRQFDEATQKYIWERDKELIQPFEVQDNASTISTGIYLKNRLCEKLNTLKITRNLYAHGLNTYQSGLVFQAGHFFSQNTHLFEKARKILPKFDLGLSDLKIDARDALGPNQQNVKIFMPVGIHHGFDQSGELDFLFESMGTQTALWLLQFILPILAEGGVCILDELDTHLHPELFETLLSLFLSEEHNPHHAQLIFSSHQHHLLNQLEKCQIQLVEKDKNCVSHTWRLDEMKGVRTDENYAAKYRAGAYGAVPEVELI